MHILPQLEHFEDGNYILLPIPDQQVNINNLNNLWLNYDCHFYRRFCLQLPQKAQPIWRLMDRQFDI